MKASTSKSTRESCRPGITHAISEDGIDRALLEESLAKSVWERMLANDDALRLANTLRAAMSKTRAKS